MIRADGGTTGRARQHVRVVSIGGAALALAAVGLVATVWQAAGQPESIGSELLAATAAGAAVATLPAVILFTLRASEGERSSNLALASGLLVLGAGVFGIGELAPLVVGGSFDVPVFRAWAAAGSVVLLSIGLSAAVARRSCRRAAVMPVLVVASTLIVAGGTGELSGASVSVVGFGALIVAYVYAYLIERRPHLLWMAVGFVGYVLGGVAAHGQGDLWTLVAGSERLLAGLVLVFGLSAEFGRSSRDRLARLTDAELQMHELSEVAHATQRLAEERNHEARNVISAIEHTAQALRRRSSLDRAAVDDLEAALAAEVSLLRRLVALRAPAGLTDFAVADAIHGVVVAERLSGLAIEIAVPPHLHAFGDPEATAQVVQNLLENARRHAPGSPVAIAAKVSGPWVVIRVDDAGPGIPPDARQRVLWRGVDGGHPTSARGSGLGLYIAERLMREQRGYLWVGEAAHRGASVRLALPISHEQASPPPAIVAAKPTAGTARAAAPIAHA